LRPRQLQPATIIDCATSHKAAIIKQYISRKAFQLQTPKMTTTNKMGSRQKYSHYLPLDQTLLGTSARAALFSKDGTRPPYNSRDAAYDEEEQLRLAIEASKGEKSGESMDGSIRRNKRGRSNSEE
jgi:hypothetical protein